MKVENDIFQDIRPYNDSEVQGALQRLIQDDEFINAIIHYRYAKLPTFLATLLKPVLKMVLTRRWSSIKTVDDVQNHIASYMEQALDGSSDGVTCSGLDKLDPNQSYLFVSNHRDIAMDPAVVNWCLYHANHKTVRIAIGDNLLKKPCATELMRLNKSFIVKRSIKAPRELMKALGQLSGYIRHSLQEENESIWIAQKEGRAKDGDDRTDPAILKMFSLEGRKAKMGFSEYMRSLNIVPVSISYENDPCDLAKANELVEKEQNGHYQKSEFEDIDSIIKGIVGEKRRIHVSFGDVVTNEFETPEALAEEIDRQVYENYKLFPINYIAAECKHDSVTQVEQERFSIKVADIDEAVATVIKSMYAMPVKKQAFETAQID
ncbi:1-acyl-sn-glycerol-3-phosphate acyltransferase [Thaumasiovibrio subtropicus]|uniref:1-acyl-sn-glycerol-3-phosphate acyltransferase n=1 Tax=Thaumasiovibrio subtropicus TaxID=1891207 RepID=UPI000B35FD16|nr:1-acyl-sn-glycerol-3-phosphate acyltransferase [Thaumasiovibrio subtropicus]